MGTLHYDRAYTFDFDDRTLTHLRSAIVSKLMMQESLLFTWDDAGRQRSIWLNPSIPMHFEFDGPDTPKINRRWVEELAASSNSPVGLRLLPEPDLS